MKSCGATGGKGKSMAGLAKRPPKLKGRVANDVYANPARSMIGPPPQGDIKSARAKAGPGKVSK
jgi:hypothetical protein